MSFMFKVEVKRLIYTSIKNLREALPPFFSKKT